MYVMYTVILRIPFTHFKMTVVKNRIIISFQVLKLSSVSDKKQKKKKKKSAVNLCDFWFSMKLS